MSNFDRKTWEKTRKEKLILDGLCTICGKNPTNTGRKCCNQCSIRSSEYKKEKLNLGICVSCPNKRENLQSYYCNSCIVKRREYERRRRNNRRLKGMCLQCSARTAINNIKICLRCWWIQKASSVTSTTSTVTSLQKLWDKQNGCCALTGEILIPGVNASLDHIIPKSKGGSSDVTNLQWVLTSINSGKHDLTQEEFIRLCKLVATKL